QICSRHEDGEAAAESVLATLEAPSDPTAKACGCFPFPLIGPVCLQNVSRVVQDAVRPLEGIDTEWVVGCNIGLFVTGLGIQEVLHVQEVLVSCCADL